MGGGWQTEHGNLFHAPRSIGLRAIVCRLTEGRIEQEERASRASLTALRRIVLGGIVPLSGLGMCLLWLGGYDHPIDLFLIGLLLLALVFAVEQHVHEASTLFPRRIAVRGHELLVSTPLQNDVHSLVDVYFFDGHAYTLSLPFRHRCLVLRIRRRALKLQVGFTEDSANLWRQCLSENGAVLVRQQSRPIRFTATEWLTLIAVAAILAGFVLIPDNHELTRRNLKQRASNWKPRPPIELVDPSVLSASANLEGAWICQHGLDHSRFTFTRQSDRQFAVHFSTGGCLGGCDLRRRAVFDAGVIQLDGAVAEYFPRTYATLYVIQIDGVDYLLPDESVRDFEHELAIEDGNWRFHVYCREEALRASRESAR